MNDSVEDELRALLAGRAAGVADARDPVAAVEAGVRRVVVRRRLVVTAGVPVLVGVVVGGAGLLSGAPQRDDAGPVAAPTPSASAVAPRSSDFPRAREPVPTPPAAPGSSTAQLSSAPTPSASPSTPAPTRPPATSQVEVYRAYLEEDPLPRELGAVSAGFGGRPYCALRVLDRSTRYAYLWIFCNEYYLRNGVAVAGSADSVPIRLTISGTGAATRVLGAAMPRSGTQERADLKALFSPLAFTRSLAYSDGLLRSPGVDQSAVQLKARAVADARSGRLRTGLNPIAP